VHIDRLESRLPGHNIDDRPSGPVRFDGRTATGQVQDRNADKNTGTTPQAQVTPLHHAPSMDDSLTIHSLSAGNTTGVVQPARSANFGHVSF
jgi:hypothetical protein